MSFAIQGTCRSNLPECPKDKQGYAGHGSHRLRLCDRSQICRKMGHCITVSIVSTLIDDCGSRKCGLTCSFRIYDLKKFKALWINLLHHFFVNASKLSLFLFRSSSCSCSFLNVFASDKCQLEKSSITLSRGGSRQQQVAALL